MILSVSRRTDIPNYYSEWFINRINAGYVYVRNPMNFHQISNIKITPDVVDFIVFWSKNPFQMYKRLVELKEYSYYFQFTLNSYGKDVEPNVPSKNYLIDTFKKISDKIGPSKIIWRYDPILINNKYNLDYHIKYFNKLANKLKNYTKKCTISFIDLYRSATNNVKLLELDELKIQIILKLVESISMIADDCGLSLDTCAENIDFSNYNISPAKCIDVNLIERIINSKLEIPKDKTQRRECGCAASIDIGTYNTCLNGCKYCYANYSLKTAKKNFEHHNKNSPLLFGKILPGDKINIRKVKSLKNNQIDLFSD